MQEPTYRQALSHSWHLVWRHKVIWILGLLSLFAGQFGLSNFFGRLFLWKDNMALFAWISYLPYFFSHISAREGLFIIWIFFIVLAVGAAVLAVAVFSQGTLIAIFTDWYRKKKINFTKGWHKGVKHFWRLFFVIVTEKYLLCLLFGLVILELSVMPSRPTFGQTALAIATLAGGILLALIASAVAVYAKAYIVEEESPLFRSLNKGAHLFSEHFLVSLELSLLLLLLNFLLILLALFGSFIALLPAVLFSVIAGFSGATVLISIGSTLSLALFILFIIVVGAIFNAFTVGSWVYLFNKMHHEGIASRLFHYLQKVFKKSK